MVSGRLTSVLAAAACIVALSGCNSNDASSPTPVTTPTPTPSGPTFSVSGTVFESAPTTSTRVPEAEVQLSGGVAYGTANDGTFTIPNVGNGTYTLNIRKAAYNTRTQQITVAGGSVTGVSVTLQPLFRIVDTIQDRRASPNDNQCGNNRACQLLTIGSHNDGESRFYAAWNNPSDELDLEWWCNGTRIARSGFTGTSGDEVKPTIVAGQTCDLRIINASNTSFPYTLYLTYPY
jgi:Carboxypeptidase regulatory-like domain